MSTSHPGRERQTGAGGQVSQVELPALPQPSTVAEAHQTLQVRATSSILDGFVLGGPSEGYVTVVSCAGRVVSVPLTDIVDHVRLQDGTHRLWTRATKDLPSDVDSAVAQLEPTFDERPRRSDRSDGDMSISLKGAFAAFKDKGSCVNGPGQPWYKNHCAHYLSDAFIRAGFSELTSTTLIQFRCPGARRPIRAQEMRRWFVSKSTKFISGMPPRNSGVWAVYQEKPDWRSGHVVLLDMDKYEYRGTNAEWYDWPTQWNYQW